MKIALGTVAYPAAMKFVDDFIQATNNQTYQEFDTLIICDGIKGEMDRKKLSQIHNSQLFHFCNRTPSQLRLLLINKAKKLNYDLLVLCDFDDSFSYNRMEKYSLQYHESYNFFYNDLRTMDQHRLVFKKMPSFTTNIEIINEKNYLGLGNTGINLDRFDLKLLNELKNKKVIAFDWLLFSLIILNGGKGKKINDCSSYYRIYKGNTAGLNKSTNSNISMEMKVKMLHYKTLVELGYNYNDFLNGYKNIKKNISINDLKLNDSDFWWASIKLKE